MTEVLPVLTVAALSLIPHSIYSHTTYFGLGNAENVYYGRTAPYIFNLIKLDSNNRDFKSHVFPKIQT